MINESGQRSGADMAARKESRAKLKPGAGDGAAQAAGTEGVNILILADAPAEAELVERTLRQAGFRYTAKQVDTKDAFVRALNDFTPDLVLSDYKRRDFDDLSAVKLVRERYGDSPVILVAGLMGDDAGVEVVKAGANDYVLEDDHARFGIAVRCSLLQAAETHDRKRAQATLQASDLPYRRLFETAKDGILILEAETGRILDVNPYMIALLGYSADEYRGKTLWEIGLFKDVNLNKAAFLELQKKGYVHYEDLQLLTKDGHQADVEFVSNTYTVDGIPVMQCNIRDVTARKKSERQLERVNRALKVLSAGNQALVRAQSEQDLFDTMCQIFVDVGGYQAACIFSAEHDEAKTVRLRARAGHDVGFMEHVIIAWADTERGRGTVGAAIRTGEPQVNQNFATDPRMAPWREEAVRHDFGSNVALPLTTGAGVFGALSVYAREPDAFDSEEVELLTELGNDLAYGIAALRDRAGRELADRRLYESAEATVAAIASMIEARDPYTSGHQRRVARLAVAVAQEMGLSEAQIRGIQLAGTVHDVGKIKIPAEILSKPGRLAAAELDLIRAHPVAGYNILKGVEFPWPVAEPVLQHHERLDGSGYPRGIAGDAILIEARILAVADVVEAVTAHRPYRPALGLDAALAEIEKGKGRLYDARAVEVCIALFRQKGFAY